MSLLDKYKVIPSETTAVQTVAPRKVSGRAPSFKRFASRIWKETGHGAELVAIAMEIARGESKVPVTARDRLEAVKFLKECALGKAPLTIDMSGDVQVTVTPLDLSKLSDAEIETARNILRRATAGVIAAVVQEEIADAELVESGTDAENG